MKVFYPDLQLLKYDAANAIANTKLEDVFMKIPP